MFPRQANAVFAELPLPIIKGLHQQGWRFHQFIGAGGCRFMCAWDTEVETVEKFAAAIKQLCEAA
jgi:threonine aldolase